MNTLFYRRFNLIWPAVSDIRDVLKTILLKLNISRDEFENTGLVLTEYLTNLIRHSDGEDESVTLVISQLDTGQIEIKLIDPTPYFSLLENEQSNTDICDGTLREGGMGLALINHYFPDYRYESLEGKNHFYFLLTPVSNQEKLLIIDDERATLALVKAYLDEHYHVIAIQNEQEARDYLMHNQVDLLLIDMNLESMKATDFLESIEGFSHLDDVAVIVMSGNSDWHTIQMAGKAFIDDFLIKPLDKKTLQVVCERVLRRRKKPVVNSPEYNQINTQYNLSHSMSMFSFGSISHSNGGDFLFHRTVGDSDYILLGDVMGHGHKASIEAQQIKGFVYGFFQAVEISLTQLVGALSDALFEENLLQNSMITLLALKVTQREIEWLSAGHPPPCILEYGKPVQSWVESQPLLGLSRHYQYKTHHFKLGTHQHLMLYTDGLFENIDRARDPATIIDDLIPQSELSGQEFAATIWKNSLRSLIKEIDDSSLVVIN